MIGRKIDALLGLIGFCTLAYGFFTIHVGNRTLYEHFLRIAHTAPAQELEADVRAKSDQVTRDVTAKVKDIAAAHGDAGVLDLVR